MAEFAKQLEALRWKRFSALGTGEVCLVDVMGDDSAIVQAARVSYGEGTKKVSDDRTLIRYLMRHRHTTPFEMCEVKLRVRVPMDCWRQWIRHRTANVNEYSTRYSVAIDDCQITSPTEWRSQATTNRQGSGDFLNEEIGLGLTLAETELQKQARDVYQNRLDAGVAREQARKDLPLSTFTEAYWKVDLHNMFHFLSLRMDSHAQKEIREYATIIGKQIIKPLYPLAWEAFEDYRLGAMFLSRLDIGVIQRLNEMARSERGYTEPDFIVAQDSSWKELERCRERDECFEKLARLGIIEVPIIAA